MDPQATDQSQDQTQPLVPIAPSAPPAEAVTPDAKQQIVERIQSGKNVLVTVGTDPSVDELASALGLTLLLNKLTKHVTTVFSGAIPPAIQFLDPEKTFEDTVDSLRDFIIALSKDKADKLRYKVEDDVVKIFITPYKTILTEKDLEFSQGDFNVDVIIALGVEKSEELDKAITAHGNILHDAAIITINAGSQRSNLGAVDWNDPEASSIAEMLVALSDALGPNLLDEQSSTAMLTGIVAETNRFSNEKTTPKVMTLSAQLMAAGANQQLVATNLRQEGMISESVRSKGDTQTDDDNGEMVLKHKDDESESNDSDKKDEPKDKPEDKTGGKSDNSETSGKERSKEDKKDVKSEAPSNKMDEPAQPEAPIAADLKKVEAELTAVPEEPKTEPELPKNDRELDLTPPELGVVQPEEGPKLEAHPEKVIAPLPEGSEPKPDEQLPTLPPLPTVDPSAHKHEAPLPVITQEMKHEPMDKPTFGGSLNATMAVAEDDREAEAIKEAQTNNLALHHGGSGESESAASADAIEEARKAVENAEETPPPKDPEAVPLPTPTLPALIEEGDATVPQDSSQPLAFTAPPIGLPQLDTPTPPPFSPQIPQQADSPVDAFVQTHVDPSGAPNLNALTSPAPTGMPPLPPMLNGHNGALPPMPPLPGQPTDPTANFQPQINPGFIQDMPQSQNTWTQASDDLAAKQAEKATQREEKKLVMDHQYDQAVDRNRELNGLPPLNDPNGTGLPPVPPNLVV